MGGDSNREGGVGLGGVGAEGGVEGVEEVLEVGGVGDDVGGGSAEGGGDGGAGGYAFEGQFEAVEGGVGEQPVVLDGALDDPVERGVVGGQVVLDFGEAGAYEGGQRQFGVGGPVARQLVVEGDIDDDARQPVARRGDESACGADEGMGIGEGINGAVQAHPGGKFGVEVGGAEAAHEVGEEVARGDGDRVVGGEVEVG